MRYKLILLLLGLFLCDTLVVNGQDIPEWFQKNMEESIGVWTTSNEAYQSEQEPFEAYGMEWEWGIGKKSIVGKLYGIAKGQATPPFWEFRQYWDPESGGGMVIQYGSDGTIGQGPLVRKGGDDTTEMVQTFVNPQGKSSLHGHTATLKAGTLNVTSYDIASDGSWSTRRSYIWHKE